MIRPFTGAFIYMNHCKNCNQTIDQQARYCDVCGQSTTSYDRPFFVVIKEMLHELLDIDGRLWLTIKTLLFRPGLLTKEYNQGKRVKYTPPLRLYLVFSILFFLFYSEIPFEVEAQHQGIPTVSEYYPKLMFMLLPVYALILTIFFRNTYYLGNLVFAIHIHCITYLVLMITTPLEYIEERHIVFVILQVLFLIYLVVYLLMAMRLNYAQGWFQTTWKYLTTFMIYMALLGLVFDVAIHYIS